mmetsp:Transcript_107091/g.238988  ORF Transcript_107091/g.238988 Transcript_107091/m.238988 type:complete len:474 (-) Transcript_107091:17-1438(-)
MAVGTTSEEPAGPLLEVLGLLPEVRTEAQAWAALARLRRVLLPGPCQGWRVLEAPLYSNHQIEGVWLLLIRLMGSSGCSDADRGSALRDCFRLLGASHNWGLVLRGSRQLRSALRDLPEGACREALEASDAAEVLIILKALGAVDCDADALHEEPWTKDLSTPPQPGAQVPWPQKDASATFEGGPGTRPERAPASGTAGWPPGSLVWAAGGGEFKMQRSQGPNQNWTTGHYNPFASGESRSEVRGAPVATSVVWPMPGPAWSSWGPASQFPSQEDRSSAANPFASRAQPSAHREAWPPPDSPGWQLSNSPPESSRSPKPGFNPFTTASGEGSGSSTSSLQASQSPPQSPGAAVEVAAPAHTPPKPQQRSMSRRRTSNGIGTDIGPQVPGGQQLTSQRMQELPQRSISQRRLRRGSLSPPRRGSFRLDEAEMEPQKPEAQSLSTAQMQSCAWQMTVDRSKSRPGILRASSRVKV